MKTNINVLELVEAFRAEAQERIDKYRAEKAAKEKALEEQGLRCLAQLQDVWPAFEQVISQLVNGRVTEAPMNHGERAIAAFELALPVPGGEAGSVYWVDRVVYVWERNGVFKFGLSYGERGGCLLGGKSELPSSEYENPADILVMLARYAGTCKAK
jgi:hypothetical protein